MRLFLRFLPITAGICFVHSRTYVCKHVTIFSSTLHNSEMCLPLWGASCIKRYSRYALFCSFSEQYLTVDYNAYIVLMFFEAKYHCVVLLNCEVRYLFSWQIHELHSDEANSQCDQKVCKHVGMSLLYFAGGDSLILMRATVIVCRNGSLDFYLDSFL